jgi:hypothetical protein
MADSKGAEAAVPAVISRRDAIIGALALAAGTLIAAKPQTALADNGEPMTVGCYLFSTIPTSVTRTSDGTPSGTYYTMGELNGTVFEASVGVFGGTYQDAVAGSTGVHGYAASRDQFGVVARNSDLNGTAIKVEGRAAFSRSGKAKITKGHSSCTVPVISGVDTGSLILATLQGSAGSGVHLLYAKRSSSLTFTIKLSKAATSTVSIAWFIVG